MENLFFGLALMIATISAEPASLAGPVFVVEQKEVLSSRTLDLKTRLPNEYGASVFADNILLALQYLKNPIAAKAMVGKWDKIREPFTVEFTLKPGETFAFHETVLPEFKNPTVVLKSKFYMDEGYKELGGLGGNGVCHLASLINWAAKTANLETTVLVNHDFYPVPGVPLENGTSIFSSDPRQNLYIKNNQTDPITFKFEADEQKVKLEITN